MKMIKIALILMFTALFADAKMFQSVEPEKAILLQSGKNKLYCSNCGMNLIKFYRTSHAMKQVDGTIHQYCSIHCLAEANSEISADTQVVDAKNLNFILAMDAFYVVGSSKKGTMTANSKYAFSTEEDAKAFVKKYGGEIMGFPDAVQIAADDLYSDNIMIGKKRSKMAAKGEKMYKSICRHTPLAVFDSISDAKTYIVNSNICGQLDDKKYQAIALYLTSKNKMLAKNVEPIKVPKDAKCPVCGMYISKYPKWAAQINIDGYTHYFDGVKDMMKFYFHPDSFHRNAKRSMITGLLVSDYYTLKPLRAQKAWYVTGSNVYGPMGNELIPFETKEQAENFKNEHSGKRVLSFDEITESIVKSLDD
ncbi:MAG: hypothetical protein B5M52_00370 [Helicobacteraceae bacterium 4484_230]|nr:MAG: hypothetical protein B5M52_00370 [Helicobacteraceae bacterium 4484_230]